MPSLVAQLVQKWFPSAVQTLSGDKFGAGTLPKHDLVNTIIDLGANIGLKFVQHRSPTEQISNPKRTSNSMSFLDLLLTQLL